MKRHNYRARFLAIALSTLAGYIDALGFLSLGGFYASFMSGNSTRLAVGLAEGSSAAAIAGSIIALFVLGVMSGSLVGDLSGLHRRRIILVSVALLLSGSATLHLLGIDHGALAVMVLAMGVENTLFEHNGEVSIGLTYMTGTLVKLGLALAQALRGRAAALSWVPYLLLWLGLVIGAVIGALIYPWLGLAGLWAAAIAAAILAVIAPSA
jgi:uncharacterized membrane protein YoaK (UPF0700 family)